MSREAAKRWVSPPKRGWDLLHAAKWPVIAQGAPAVQCYVIQSSLQLNGPTYLCKNIPFRWYGPTPPELNWQSACFLRWHRSHQEPGNISPNNSLPTTPPISQSLPSFASSMGHISQTPLPSGFEAIGRTGSLWGDQRSSQVNSQCRLKYFYCVIA